MHSHPNARLTQKSRLRLINQHLQDRRPQAELAAEAGISLRCAYKWLARYRSGGAASLADRPSVRHTQRRTLDPQLQRHAVELRHQRPPPPAHRQAARRSLLHRGQGAQPPWSRAVAESRAQPSSVALTAGVSR
jgi:hypothetical protein